MTDPVTAFRPANGQDLSNVPHMLRYWATEIEAGRLPGHQVLAVMFTNEWGVAGHPYQIGQVMAPEELIGHLFAVMSRVANARLSND